MKHWRETTEIVQRVLALAAAGRHAALATVIRIEGSSYRRPGAKFLIEDDGHTMGGVSGGCLEADVRENALPVVHAAVPAQETMCGLGQRGLRLGAIRRLPARSPRSVRSDADRAGADGGSAHS